MNAPAKYLTLAILSLFLAGLATAFEQNTTIVTDNGSYVIIEMPPPLYNFTNYSPPEPAYRIIQGGTVYLNDTIDISGMGWGTGLAWYGRYGEHSQPAYIYEFTNWKRGLMTFWLDPEIFGTRTGVWYQYYGNETERNGNLVAFRINSGARNSTMTFQNGTVVNVTEHIRGNGTPLVIKPESLLPEVHVADYLLAVGDPLEISTGGISQVWIFGSRDYTYGATTTTKMQFNAQEFYNFQEGRYTILVQHPGQNTDFDIRYHNKTLQYKEGWSGIRTMDVSIQPPAEIQKTLMAMFRKCDDRYDIFSLEIQQPSVTINRMDDVWLASKVKEYGLGYGDITFKDVRGYTNFKAGTNITIVLDNDYRSGKGIGRFSTVTTAARAEPGNQSIFQAYVPIVWDQIPTGMHTVTATGPLKTQVNANFLVSILPPDSFRPNTTLKYTGDENPWKPNLTTPAPVIVTQVIRETVTVQVTPSDEQVKAQQDAVMYEHEVKWATLAGLVAALCIVGAYAYSVLRRWKKV